MPNDFIGFARVKYLSRLLEHTYSNRSVGEVSGGVVVPYFTPLTSIYGTPRVEIFYNDIFGWVPANDLEPLSPLEQLAHCAKED